MLGLLGGVALAGIVSDVGVPLDLNLPGRHGRPFLTDVGQRWLGFGRSGSFHAVRLDASGAADAGSFITLVEGGGEFIDHSFVPCAGGGFLHVASGNRITSDDTAWVSFVSRDLQWRGTEALVDSDDHYTTNDMPAVCAAGVWATGFATEGDLDAGQPGSNEVFAFGPSLFGGGGGFETIPLPRAARMTGTSMVWRDDTRQLIAVGIRPPAMLRIVSLDENLIPATSADRELDVGSLDAYWAQSTALVDGSMLIAHMVRGNDAGFAQDTGNVALTVLGPELQVLETNILTSFSPPSGAMRPALLVDGDEIVVSFDVGGALHTVQARVDVEALRALQVVVGSADGAVRERRGVEDTGLDSSSGPGAVAGHGDGYSAAERGGCASVPAPAGPVRALAFVGLLGLLRRRG